MGALSGAGVGNYALRAVTANSANITPKPVTGSYTAIAKVYDGTAVATLSEIGRAAWRGSGKVSVAAGNLIKNDTYDGGIKTVDVNIEMLIPSSVANYYRG